MTLIEGRILHSTGTASLVISEPDILNLIINQWQQLPSIQRVTCNICSKWVHTTVIGYFSANTGKR
jgi:hypothetical protein